MKKTKRDLEFIYEVGALRFLQRNWKQFLNADFQNISEHTFRVIWIALILAKHENVNSHEKIIKMALVHDLSESRTGDAHYVGDEKNIQIYGKNTMRINVSRPKLLKMLIL
ncbi:MAG: HD domain-containing protein [Candidatus Berkelbacteria bacterium]|nr:HD domain-containing protein [Candidatus Berkelbacteria bacterium]